MSAEGSKAVRDALWGSFKAHFCRMGWRLGHAPNKPLYGLLRNSRELSSFATRVINEVKGIDRVVCDYTSKLPSTSSGE